MYTRAISAQMLFRLNAMKKTSLITLLVAFCMLSTSIESNGQKIEWPADSVVSEELTEYKESDVAREFIGVGWALVVVGAVTNTVGLVINKFDRNDPSGQGNPSDNGHYLWNRKGGPVIVVGLSLVAAGSIAIGVGGLIKGITKKLKRRENRVDDTMKYIADMDTTLCRLISDVDDSTYYARIMNFISDSNYYVIQLREERYPNGQVKFIGLKSKHAYGRNPDYLYKIGTWKYFYSNGQLKKRINYDLRENKHGLYEEYDKTGVLIIREQYTSNKR